MYAAKKEYVVEDGKEYITNVARWTPGNRNKALGGGYGVRLERADATVLHNASGPSRPGTIHP